MRPTRREFIAGCGALAASASLASPIRSAVGSSNSGFAADDGPMPTAEDYVQDDLVSLWDCIENVGLGEHDPASTEWVDLVAGRKFTQVAFEDDCACVVQSQRTCNFNGPYLDSLTCELVCSRVAGTTQNHSLQTVQYMRVGGVTTTKGFSAQRYPVNSRQYVGMMMPSILTDAVPEEVNCLAATFEYVDGVGYIKYYLDGRQIGEQEWQAEVEFYSKGLYNYIYPNNRLYRISLYHRALGADEIAYNAFIDRRRFGL